MRIAVIPARGGSKRIPRKNIKLFNGKPMIAWSIEAAKSSGLFEHIIVSTDDEEIAEVSKQWGAEVPFIRPKELSNDHSGTTEVIAHATQWALVQGWSVSAVCCILATAPFILVDDIKRGLDLLQEEGWAYTIAVTNFAAPIFRSFYEHSDGGVEMFFPEFYLTRSQDLTEAWHDAAQFYWGKPNAWVEQKPGLGRHSGLVKIPRWRVQDIDNDEDWKRAELLGKLIKELGISNDKTM
jgi:pseudaminic acid cytidylyltransferase